MAGIQVKIGADTADFDSAIKRVTAQTKQLRSELRQGITDAAKYGAAAAAAGAAIGTHLVKQSLKAVDALAKTSDKLGIATEDLQALRHAADLTGVGTNQLEMGLQRMTRRVAEASQGMGEAQDAIKQLGLDAQALAQLSPDEQFRRITAAMEGVSSQGERIRLAFKLFDSEGVNLVNTMALGADGLDSVRQELDDLGVSLTRIDAAQIEAANDAFTRVGLAVDGVSNQMAVQLAPVIEAVAMKFVGAGKEAGGMANLATTATNKIIDGIAFAADAVEGLRRVFEVAGKSGAVIFLGISEAALSAANIIINGPVNAINELIRVANMLPGVDFGMVGLTGIGQSIQAELEIVRGALAVGVQDIQSVLLEPLPGADFSRYVEETRAAAEVAAAELHPMILESNKLLQDSLTEQEKKGSEDRKNNTKSEHDLYMQMLRERQATTDQIMGNITSLMGTQSRKLFEIGKAAGISNAIVSTYTGASKALELGWPLGPIAAAAITANGLAKVQAIKSQSFGAGGVGNAAQQSTLAQTPGFQQQQQPAQNQTVSINLEGEVFGRDQVRGLIGQINDALDDGYTLRV